jgi:hypothetical protein
MSKEHLKELGYYPAEESLSTGSFRSHHSPDMEDSTDHDNQCKLAACILGNAYIIFSQVDLEDTAYREDTVARKRSASQTFISP